MRVPVEGNRRRTVKIDGGLKVSGYRLTRKFVDIGDREYVIGPKPAPGEPYLKMDHTEIGHA